MRRMCVLVLWLSMIAVTASPTPVSACTPTAVPLTPFPTLTTQERDDATRKEIQTTFAGADAVFRARVVSAAPFNRNNQSLERAELVPLVTWKGPQAPTFVVFNVRGNNFASAAICVAPFYLKPNTEYIVYAYDRKDGTYDAGTRTRAVADADEDLRVLGPGTSVVAPTATPLPLPATPTTAPSSTPLAPTPTVASAPPASAPPAATTRGSFVIPALVIVGVVAVAALAIGAVARRRSRRP